MWTSLQVRPRTIAFAGTWTMVDALPAVGDGTAGDVFMTAVMAARDGLRARGPVDGVPERLSSAACGGGGGVGNVVSTTCHL